MISWMLIDVCHHHDAEISADTITGSDHVQLRYALLQETFRYPCRNRLWSELIQLVDSRKVKEYRL